MILPSIIPLVGLVIMVLTLFHFSQKRSRLAESTRQEYEQLKTEIASADREADRVLLEDLANSDHPEKLIKERINARASVVPTSLAEPEEWAENDLRRWLNQEATNEIKQLGRPIIFKGIGVALVIAITTIISVILCFKVKDLTSTPSRRLPNNGDHVFNSQTDASPNGGQELPDSFFSDEASNE